MKSKEILNVRGHHITVEIEEKQHENYVGKVLTKPYCDFLKPMTHESVPDLKQNMKSMLVQVLRMLDRLYVVVEKKQLPFRVAFRILVKKDEWEAFNWDVVDSNIKILQEFEDHDIVPTGELIKYTPAVGKDLVSIAQLAMKYKLWL